MQPLSRIKNPFISAFLLGILLLHGFRIWSHHRVGIPAPLKQLAQWHLQIQSKGIVKASDFRGQVVLMAIWQRPPNESEQRLLFELEERLKKHPIQLVWLEQDGLTTLCRGRWLCAKAQKDAMAQLNMENQGSITNRLILIDGKNRLRAIVWPNKHQIMGMLNAAMWILKNNLST